MRYIDESLAPGETIIARGKWPTVLWALAWIALLVLGIILVGVFIFAGMAIKMKTTDFAVTNRRVILKQGWLNRKTHELAVESVEGVSLDQSIWARLFGYGRVVVTGTGEAIIVFPPMAHPVEFRRAIEAARADCGGEVHLAREDRAALHRAAEASADAANANEPEGVEGVREAEPEHDERPRKRRSFIGLRARR